MEEKAIRVFVGNLPPDINEEKLKSKIGKYAFVTDVEIKRRSEDLFAFVNLKDSQANLDKCFQILPQKSWKGHHLKVQLAKESFLQRLAKERLENANLCKQNKTIASYAHDEINGPKKCQESSNHHFNNSRNEINDKADDSDVDNTEDSSSNSSSEEIPMRGHLKMFGGTKVLLEYQLEEEMSGTNSKLKSSTIRNKKLDEEKEILQKFEMFNSVWKDTSSDDSMQNPERNFVDSSQRKKRKKQTLRNSDIKDRQMEEESTVQTKSLCNRALPQAEIKIEESEKRRMRAMEERQKELAKRKQAVKSALAQVDTASMPNKRIVFTDDNATRTEHVENSSYRNGNQKLVLFSDDDMECETNDDFHIRNHFEGEKGQSLLALQARYANDKRFTLNERFIESDDEKQEVENKIENTDAEQDRKEEREKLLCVLETVLGKEITDTSKSTAKHITKPMLRYDPTKPDHVKFEIKQNLSEIKSKKDSKKDASAIVNEISEKDDLPVVSKETYYRVSDTLREAFQNSEQNFCLSKLFDGENENGHEEDADIQSETKHVIKTKEWTLNPFKDSSSSEDETDKKSSMINSDGMNVGVKQESLFFNENDARFVEGLDFMNQVNEEYMENFIKLRKDLKGIVKKKVNSNKQRAAKWKMKLGGNRKKLMSGRSN